MGRPKKTDAKRTTIPLRIDDELHADIKNAAARIRPVQNENDVMRLAMEIGLSELKRIGFDLTSAVVDKATALAEAKEKLQEMIKKPIHEGAKT